MARRSLLTLPVVLVLLGSACGGSPDAVGAGTPTDPPVATSTPTGTHTPTATAVPTPPPSPSPTPALEDGKHFGFIRSVDAGADPPTMVLDLAYFLTGDAAAEAAREHGDEYPPPNDYYIVNDNPKLRTLELAPDARIRLIDWTDCCETFFTGELGSFGDAFVTPDPSGRYQGGTSPYWIWVRDGRVVRIEEQYLP